MRVPGLPPAHDLVRFERPCHSEMVEAFCLSFRHQPPPWNYGLARRLSRFAFSGTLTKGAIDAACNRLPENRGREHNRSALNLIRVNGKGPSIEAYKARASTPLMIRTDLGIHGRSHFYYVEEDRVRVVFVQARRSYQPTDPQFGLFRALMEWTLLKGDLSDHEAECEIIDLSAPSKGERDYRLLRVSDLPSIDEAELTERLTRLVAAYDEAVRVTDWSALKAEKLAREAQRAARAARRYRRDNPGLFPE